jgi:4'-phosphopantetheinyl transferase
MKDEKQSILIFHTDFKEHDHHIEYYLSLLNNQEQKRSQEYTSSSAQKKFIIRRGILRCLIAHLRSLPPNSINFTYNNYGKPQFSQDPSLDFSLSYSHETLVYAFAQYCTLGIDIQHHKTLPSTLHHTQMICTSKEIAMLHACKTEQERTILFYDLWSAKESWIKARGIGLHNLNEIEITQQQSFYNKHLKIKDYYSCVIASQKAHPIKIYTLISKFNLC